jgi:hypothetical protein
VRRHRAKARSILVVLESEELLTIAQFAAARSFLWFTAIKSIEGEERLAGLSPQSCFVAAEPIQREIGQICQRKKQRASSTL